MSNDNEFELLRETMQYQRELIEYYKEHDDSSLDVKPLFEITSSSTPSRKLEEHEYILRQLKDMFIQRVVERLT